MPNGPYVVQPVIKALRVLELVASRGHDVSLTEVAGDLGIPKTTTFRYLQTLAAAEFIRHDSARDRYSIGPRFRMLAAANDSLQSLRNLARPVMAELWRTYNETINLAIAEDTHIVYLDILMANRSLVMRARIGEHHPMHSTALGKAILAFLPEVERDIVLAKPLVEMTSRTITDHDALMQQLRRTRGRGYAVEIEENEDGATCLGAPILDKSGYPVAAISISAPRTRMNREITARAAQSLIAAVETITRGLRGERPAEEGQSGSSTS